MLDSVVSLVLLVDSFALIVVSLVLIVSWVLLLDARLVSVVLAHENEVRAIVTTNNNAIKFFIDFTMYNSYTFPFIKICVKNIDFSTFLCMFIFVL